MTITHVKAHTRGKPDPFATIIEARRRSLAARYGIELVGTDDQRLIQAIPAPSHGPKSRSEGAIRTMLRGIAKLMGMAP